MYRIQCEIFYCNAWWLITGFWVPTQLPTYADDNQYSEPQTDGYLAQYTITHISGNIHETLQQSDPATHIIECAEELLLENYSLYIY